MREGDAEGVEEEASEAVTLTEAAVEVTIPVGVVEHQRVSHAREVTTNLVMAPALDHRLDVRAVWEALEHLVVRLSG
jgi:hypothetical protein